MAACLDFDYRPGPLQIVDNGHSVQVDVANGSTLSVGGRRFEFVQFHFHKPSEETIDGRHFDMEVHLVHRDSKGRLAVVAVLLNAGAENSLIAALWPYVPREKNRRAFVPKVLIDPSGLLPRTRGYFTYVGSLTTPPCTEDVRWFVMKSPVFVSAAQVGRFGKLYALNARPIQPINARVVIASK